MERERIPDATLKKLQQHFPAEVEDLRAAEGAQSIATAERALAVNFFLRPSLGRRVLSLAEEAGLGLVVKGLPYPAEQPKPEKK